MREYEINPVNLEGTKNRKGKEGQGTSYKLQSHMKVGRREQNHFEKIVLET